MLIIILMLTPPLYIAINRKLTSLRYANSLPISLPIFMITPYLKHTLERNLQTKTVESQYF